jgi:hypothetical protein
MMRHLMFLGPAPLLAHMVSMSTGELRIEGHRAQYELRMPAYEVAHIRDPERTLLEHIHFRSGGQDARMLEKSCGEQPSAYVCSAAYDFPALAEPIEVECTFAAVTVPNHVHLLRAYEGAKSDQAVFDLSFTTAEIRFRPPPAWETAARATAAGFMRAAGGLAPLLFLASLTLAARGRRELAMLTASFVMAESAACLLADRLPVQLSPRFIEAAAALTVAYLAFEIVLLPNSGARWLVVGILGLFHGAYFSLFLASSGFPAAAFLSGVIGGELLLIALFAFVFHRVVSVARIPRAIPAAASLLLVVSTVWFFVRLVA